jgi:hypothetical protein
MLSFKLVEWASLDYILKTLRQPQLVQDWQVQNMLLLTFGYSYSRRQFQPPPPRPRRLRDPRPAAGPGFP